MKKRNDVGESSKHSIIENVKKIPSPPTKKTTAGRRLYIIWKRKFRKLWGKRNSY